MDLIERIVIDPQRRFGQPTVRGTRISVGDVLAWLAQGMSSSEIVADFPQLVDDDIRACLLFAARQSTGVAVAA